MEGHICCICRDELKNPIIFTPCIHGFHLGCMAQHIKIYDTDIMDIFDDKNAQCPVCRHDLDYNFLTYIRNTPEYKTQSNTSDNASVTDRSSNFANNISSANNYFSNTPTASNNYVLPNTHGIAAPQPLRQVITSLLNTPLEDSEFFFTNIDGNLERKLEENKMQYEQFPRRPIINPREAQFNSILEHILCYLDSNSRRRRSLRVADNYARDIFNMSNQPVQQILNPNTLDEYKIHQIQAENNAVGHRMNMEYHTQMLNNYINAASINDRNVIFNLLRSHIPDAHVNFMQLLNLQQHENLANNSQQQASTIPTNNVFVDNQQSIPQPNTTQNNTLQPNTTQNNSNLAQTHILDKMLDRYNK